MPGSHNQWIGAGTCNLSSSSFLLFMEEVTEVQQREANSFLPQRKLMAESLRLPLQQVLLQQRCANSVSTVGIASKEAFRLNSAWQWLEGGCFYSRVGERGGNQYAALLGISIWLSTVAEAYSFLRANSHFTFSLKFFLTLLACLKPKTISFILNAHNLVSHQLGEQSALSFGLFYLFSTRL